MEAKTTKPDRIEVSNHFFHDALDFQIRFDHCFFSDGPLFFTPRSRHAKCFIDLRIGIESILKSFLSYFHSGDKKGKELVKWVEKYSHRVREMLKDAEPYLQPGFKDKYGDQILSLDSLPVGLRYRLDAWDFRGNKEDFYCDTVGCDSWLQLLHEALKELIQFMNENLKQHTRILGSAELWDELVAPHYEKYT